MIGEAGAARAPDFVEPLVGFRSFRIQGPPDGEACLVSPHTNVRWERTAMMAECRRETTDHAAPQAYCSCGFYAYYDLDRVIGHANCVLTLAGLVTLTGRIEAHRQGMRAARVHLHALGYGPDWPRRAAWTTAADVAAKLGVPLVPVQTLQVIAGEFGRALAPEQRPFYEPPPSAAR